MATLLSASLRGRRSRSVGLGSLFLIVALVSACASTGAVSAPSASALATAPSSSSPASASSGGSSPTASAATAGSSGSATAQSGTLTLYTSVTQNTVDGVVAAYKAAYPEVTVNVFRAATGELAGKIATELRSGGLKADVVWLTDPLSMQAYGAQGLLKTWQPAGADAIDAPYRSDSFWGTRLLNMVMVAGTNVAPGPVAWHDLTNAAYKDAVALPDPGFAGSAFGALGYFDSATGFGMDFYRQLKANGATQVKAPDDVTTGVAEGRFKAGMTLDNSARTAIAKGSPIKLVWPSDGAIAMYSPIAVSKTTANGSAAEGFVELVLSDAGQKAIAATGWEPMLAGEGGPGAEGPQVYPDWKAAASRQTDLLTEYRAIFGG